MSGAHLRANANTLATTADRPRPLGPSPLRKVHTDNLVTLDSQVVAATDPTIEIPLAILDVVQVVINGRKAACSWYAAYTARQVSEAVKHIEKSNGRHQYFVDVLQQVLDILKKEAKRRRPKRKKKFDMATAINELSNLYLHLEVEEPENADLEVVDQDSSCTHRPVTANPDSYTRELAHSTGCKCVHTMLVPSTMLCMDMYDFLDGDLERGIREVQPLIDRFVEIPAGWHAFQEAKGEYLQRYYTDSHQRTSTTECVATHYRSI